ncbi:MAG: hypothetical protein COA63_013645 [Methylophaga sp.]|nr:hypothetical protein [Methylophaga sp.]
MEIISRFIDLCLFRAHPSDLPASQWLLKLTLFTYFASGIAVNMFDSELGISALTSLVDVIFMIIVVVLLLNFRNFQTRYTQTVTALAGTGFCFTLVALPLFWWFYQIDIEQQAANLIALVFLFAWLIWGLMVTVHIFRHSLEVKAGTATLITLAYIAISILITGLIMSGAA